MLKIQNISKHFGGVTALDKVFLKIEQGMVVGILGDNGAGKSTLMKCISGAILPDSGTITFDGKEISLGDPSIIRKLGIEMIYQDLSLCGQQDVLSNIFLGRELKIKSGFLDNIQMRKTGKEVLEQLGIKIPLDKEVRKLSGGQQQTIAISRAMMFKPKLVIMDEPTSALAVKEVNHVLDMIRHLKKQGVSVIIISHRLQDVFEVADRIIIMKQGRIQTDKPVAKITLKDAISQIIGE